MTFNILCLVNCTDCTGDGLDLDLDFDNNLESVLLPASRHSPVKSKTFKLRFESFSTGLD